MKYADYKELWNKAETIEDALDLLHEAVRLGEDGDISCSTAFNMVEDAERILRNKLNIKTFTISDLLVDG